MGEIMVAGPFGISSGGSGEGSPLVDSIGS